MDKAEEEENEGNVSDREHSYGSYGDEFDDDYGDEKDGVKVKYPKEIKDKAKAISQTLVFADNANLVRIEGELLLIAAIIPLR